MTRTENIVLDSILAQAEGKPLQERIELYRAHARTTSSERIASHLFECADELETADRRCHQLLLKSRQGGA